MSARLRIVALALVGVVLASGCSLVGGGGGGQYKLVAYFPRAVSLYPSSQVRVLGLPAGHVDSVDVEGTRVKVTMSVDNDIPVPKDVRAIITPQSLIGERYVQLTPAWKTGEDKATDGMEIKDTIVPVEPDEALAALKKFLDSLDPNGLGRLINNAATDLQGQGATLNHALDQVSQLVSTFADKDQQLADIVDNFDQFTATLETRESQLGDILKTFSEATQVLADERQGIEDLLNGLSSLSTNGLQLVSKHSQRLKGDLDTLARLAQSIDVNLGSLGQLLDSGPNLVHGLIGAYNPQLRALNLRNDFGGVATAALTPFLDFLGIPGSAVPCIPIDQACENNVLPLASGAATPASLPVATTPIDDLLGLLGAPTTPPPPPPSTSDRVANGMGAVGGFFRDAAGAMAGGS